MLYTRVLLPFDAIMAGGIPAAARFITVPEFFLQKTLSYNAATVNDDKNPNDTGGIRIFRKAR